MSVDSVQSKLENTVYVRFGETSRLEGALIEAGSALVSADIVVVQSSVGERRPARLVGSCPSGEDVALAGTVVAGYNINSASTTTIGEVLDVSATNESTIDGHRWGALGLPSGPNTKVTRVIDALASDVEFALQSRGYAEVQTDPLHRLVPGDRAIFRGAEVMVNAIDRRRDRVELVLQHDQTNLDVALSLFLEETRTDDTVHGGAQPDR